MSEVCISCERKDKNSSLHFLSTLMRNTLRNTRVLLLSSIRDHGLES